MDDNYGDLEIDENQLKAADPDGLYLFMLKDHPCMMAPDNVAAFTGTTGQEIRKLLNKGEVQGCRIGIRWLIPKLGLLNYLYKDRRKKASPMPLALKCDKPYNIDEARKRKGLPRSKREDSRTTMYELTIRIPDDFQVFFDGKTKFTRRAFVLNRRELQDEVRAFEDEKNEEFIREKDDYEKSLEAKGKVTQALPLNDIGYCTASLTEFAERYIEVRSHGSVSEETIKNELNYMRYIRATIGDMVFFEVRADNIERCLIAIPRLSRIWAEERKKALEENRKTAKWAKEKKTLVKPLKEPRTAGSDTQAKVLKFLREVYNYGLGKEQTPRNPAHARFLAGCSSRASPSLIRSWRTRRQSSWRLSRSFRSLGSSSACCRCSAPAFARKRCRLFGRATLRSVT